MRYYIISFVLNTVLIISFSFFVLRGDINGLQSDTIPATVMLSLENTGEGSGFMSPEGGGGGGGSQNQQQYSGSASKNEKTLQPEAVPEKSRETEYTKTEKVTEKNQENITASRNSEKTAKTTDINENKSGGATASTNDSSNPTKTASGSGSGTGNGSGTGSGTGSGVGSENGSGIGSGNGAGTSTGKGSGKNSNDLSYLCKEGVGYKIISNPKPKIQRTKAEELEIKKGSKVSVGLRFNSNGSVSVKSISGGNERIRGLVSDAVSGMKISVMDSNVVKCPVTKTYTIN